MFHPVPPKSEFGFLYYSKLLRCPYSVCSDLKKFQLIYVYYFYSGWIYSVNDFPGCRFPKGFWLASFPGYSPSSWIVPALLHLLMFSMSLCCLFRKRVNVLRKLFPPLLFCKIICFFTSLLCVSEPTKGLFLLPSPFNFLCIHMPS